MRLFENDMDTPLDQLDDDGMNFDDNNDDILNSSGSDMMDTPLDQLDDDGMNFDDNPNISQKTEDPDFQGTIRIVKGAVLVYKRKTPEDAFEELWIFNIGKDMKKESQIRRAILAGTDIDPRTGESENGGQSLNSYSIGNVQFLQLNNLEN